MIEGILVAVVGTSMEELVLLLPPSLLHRIRACCNACEFDGAAEKLDKAFEEVKAKVENARAKVVEEEERVAGMEKGVGCGPEADCCAQGEMIREGRGGGGRRRRRRGRNRMLKCVGGGGEMARRRIV